MIDLANPEVRFAIDVVRKAVKLAREVQCEMVAPALAKEDKSPVTVGDFAVQALVGGSLHGAFPNDPLVAEESSGALRSTDGQSTLERVTEFVRRVVPDSTPEKVCQWIDWGRGEPTKRFWTLDPIDGTKGFLRGAQYAVALALMVEGERQIGVLGCPNLEGGSLVAAARGQGSWRSRLGAPEKCERLHVSECRHPAQARVLRSVESDHTNVHQMDDLMRALGVEAEPVLMDSQAKYAVLAAGEGDLLFRLLSPDRPNYRENIWDQVAGSLILEEAGGRITDLEGKSLDFSAGKTLAHNRGVVASNGHLHEVALEMIKRIRASE